jgi:hypothetical protein
MKKQRLVAIAFFLGGVATKKAMHVFEKKKTTMHRHILLWWCYRKDESDSNNYRHLFLW